MCFHLKFYNFIFLFKSYTWKIYLRCVAGGNGVSNLAGTIVPVNFYLGSKQGTLNLPSKYSWIKCNKDFKSFYVTSYSENNVEQLIDVVNKKVDVCCTLKKVIFVQLI